MKFRYLSLYFASIGLKEAILLAFYSCFSIFFSNSKKNIESYFNNKDIYLFSSARGALSAFLQANNINDGDSVLLSSFTCLAVPTAVIASGARPIYADINPLSLNVNFEEIKEKVESNTKVIVVQHTMGRAMDDMDKIVEFAATRDILVVEDCALSLGSSDKGKKVGSTGDAAIFSLELSKTLSSGWGGVLVNNNTKLTRSLKTYYNKTDYEPLPTRARKLIQIIITGIFYNKYVYFVGKYFVSMAYKISFFKGSTPPNEYVGKVSSDFVSKLSKTQGIFANNQFKRVQMISNINNRNFINIKNYIELSGLTVLGDIKNDHFPVTPRICFLVKDKKNAREWFINKGIELGSWFDGCLSTSTIFNFEQNLFENVSKVSMHIVNLPCHNRLTDSDLVFLKLALLDFTKENPEERNFNFFQVK
jgi:dTDP-4-amino-4,6-dideoxygalactose transaminase